MPNWNDLRKYIDENYRLLDEGEDFVVLGWQQREQDGSLTRQAVFCFAMTAYAEPWVILQAKVCPEESLPARQALLLSADLTIGSLVLSEGVYLLRNTFSIYSLPLPDILLTVERMAWAAVALRQHIMNGAPLSGQVVNVQPSSALVAGHWTE